MLCRKIKQSLLANLTLNKKVQINYLIAARFYSKRCMFDSFISAVSLSEGRLSMSSFRLVLKDFSVKKLWGVWTRSFIVNTVVKRCRRDRGVRDVLQLFKQTIRSPRRTFFLSATAAFKVHAEDTEKPPSCENTITDEELQALTSELERVEVLSQKTLFCSSCGKRLVIDKKLPAVSYCSCKDPSPEENLHEGWEPYIEAEDVIIWRKEYKQGQGLYAYKVYGRYKDIRAQDFAAVQVDGAYRLAWDAAVAALSVVESRAYGAVDQAILHWEVLWPRLFANRDYVYIRRHKQFDVKCSPPPAKPAPQQTERESVHSHAKRKAREEEERERQRKIEEGAGCDNKVFVIMSRSCSHPAVPETKHAIRVTEYWSHMVIRSTHGPDQPGMEFVLTYYDEPAVGGLPGGVAAWASGRAAPAYLAKMRRAAGGYDAWRQDTQDLPEFVTSEPSDQPREDQTKSGDRDTGVTVSEEDMESSKDGPDLQEETKRDQCTQTEEPGTVSTQTQAGPPDYEKGADESEVLRDEKLKLTSNIVLAKEAIEPERDGKPEDEEAPTTDTGRWWRYLYPSYYFL